MKAIDKERLLSKAADTLSLIVDDINKLSSVDISNFETENTALVIVDMVNGFAKEGMLKDKRVKDMIPDVVDLGNACGEKGMAKIIFSDCHTQESPEFESYPAHCLKGTPESDIVDELKELKDYVLVNKNSTNGFLEDEFKTWLEKNKNIFNFIVVGDCTDICVMQFCETLKTYYNIRNRKVNIVVPMNCVDTYDLGNHNADLNNIFCTVQHDGKRNKNCGKH